MFARIFLSLFFDFLERFLNFGDPDGDLFLLLFQFFQGHNFAANFGEVGRFRRAFTTEGNLRFLQHTFLVLERKPRRWRRAFKASSRKPVRIKFTVDLN